jgi:hypothetical protein
VVVISRGTEPSGSPELPSRLLGLKVIGGQHSKQDGPVRSADFATGAWTPRY